MKKYNINDFIKKAKQVHSDKYDYSKVEYVNSQTKVCIVCPEHGEFWQTPSNHLHGQNCPKCSNISTHEKQKSSTQEFIKHSKEIHGDKYDYSKVDYVNNRVKVCVICPEHGEFWQKPNGHLYGRGCPYCGKTKKLSLFEFIKKAKEIHGNKYDYSKVEYINYETKVCIICPEHGEFWQTPHEHLSGGGCPLCIRYVHDKNTFIECAKNIHYEKYDYSKVDYINYETKVCIICPEHGEFWQTPHNHIGLKQGCPICNESKLEKKIRILLEKENIKFEPQKTFEWLKNKNNLYLDFYLPDYNIAIECQGEQHFEPNDFFGGTESFLNRQKLDFLKYKLCNEHKINVIYFSNKQYDYFKEVITEENNLIEKIYE